MDNLFDIAHQIGLQPRTVMEVGAAHPDTAQLRAFALGGTPTILIEANPRLHYCLVHGFNKGNFEDSWPTPPPEPYAYHGFGALGNVTIHNVAIVERAGPVQMFECNASSFVAGTQSPIKVNNGFVESDSTDGIKSIIKGFPYGGPAHVTVRGATIDEFDNGQIDILAVDTEGCEYWALDKLISRPRLICLETHGQAYVNPLIDRIVTWMQTNGYAVAGQTESDTLFIKT